MTRFFNILWSGIVAFFCEPKPQPSLPDPTEPPPESDVRTGLETPNGNEIGDSVVNKSCIDIICKWEGLHKQNPDGMISPYLDPVGIPTIGWGTIQYPNGNRVKMSDPRATKEQCRSWLMFEVDQKALELLEYFKKINLGLTPNEFAALVSFSYNLGNGVVMNPRTSMGSAVASRDLDRIAKAFGKYVYATKRTFGIPRKVKLAGLVNRRSDERKLFERSF